MELLQSRALAKVPTALHRYDRLTQSEADPHLEELLGLVVWLTTCGRSELKVFDSITYPQLEGFKFHHEASGGSRCLWAFPGSLQTEEEAGLP